MIAQRESVYKMLYAVPLIKTSDLGLRHLPACDLKHSWEYAVVADQSRREFRRLRTPFGVAVQLRPRSHEHRHPVGSARRGEHRTLGQSPASALHLSLHARHIGAFHTVGAPSVKTDKNHMVGNTLGARRHHCGHKCSRH